MHDDPKIIELSPADSQYFQKFYEDRIGLICYFARRYTLSKSDFDDLVQNVIVRLMKHIDSLRKIDNNSAKVTYYIQATVQTAFIDHYRSEQKRKAVAYPDGILDKIIEERLCLEILQFEDTHWHIQLLKDNLSERDWMLLEGKYIIEYSDEELGARCGCSKDSVRMALTRARQKAKRILFDQTYGGDSDEQ